MKKVFVAGLASVALAAVPVLSSFAEASMTTDTLTINLTDSCEFERTVGDGDYGVTLHPGSYALNFASSTFTVTCNTPDTYTVTAQFSDLLNTTNENESIVYSAADPNGTASTWQTKLGATNNIAVNLSNGDTILSASSANGGASAVVRYSVGAASDQGSGTYTGKATYTLVSGI